MPGYEMMQSPRDRITQALMNIRNPPPGGGAMLGGMSGMPAPMPGSQMGAFGPQMGGPQMGAPQVAPSMNIPGVSVNATPPGMKQPASQGY